MNAILTVTLNPTVDLFGEVDVVRPVRKMRTEGDRADPGGGGINVARVVAMLGGEAEALFLGGGATGRWLDALLDKHGIGRRMVPIAGETRVSYSVHERGSGLDYRFVPAGPEIRADEYERCVEIAGASTAGFVVASGSLPSGAPGDLLARLARQAAARGARFVLDTSGKALAATLESGGVFLVKPSHGELEQLAGRELDEDGTRDVACGIVERGGAECVAVTLGAQGALVATREGVHRLSSPKVKARSAVGAGDSFLGAMVWALARGWDVRSAAELGVAAGAAAVLTPGTELCRREDVEALYRASFGGTDAAEPAATG